MANINELKARATEIRKEMQEGRNTAEKVGSLLCDMIDYDDRTENSFDSEITDLQELYVALTQSDLRIVDTLPATGEPNVIYRVPGTTSYSDYMYRPTDLTHEVCMATYSNALDTTPTLESGNVVTSGGVANKIFNVTSSEETTSVAEDGYYVKNPSGNKVAQIDFAITESIILPAYNFIQFSAGESDDDEDLGGTAVLAIYDSEEDKYTPVLSNVQTGVATYAYQSLEDGDITVRISYKKSYGAPVVHITDNIVASAVQTDVSPTKDSRKLITSGSVYENALQKFSLTWVDSYYINWHSGNASYLVSYSSTDFIPILGFKQLTICTTNNTGDVNVGYAFYDSNKRYLSGGANPESRTMPVENTFSVPENAYYIRYSFYLNGGGSKSDSYLCGYNLPSAISAAVMNAINPVTPTDEKYWAYALGNILCIGDSLTSGAYILGHGIPTMESIRQNYPYYLSRMLGAEVENAGFSGITTSEWYSQKLSSYTYTDYDSVIIWLGTNGGLNPDDINVSGTNTNDYCNIIDAIQTANSDIKIFVVKVFNADGPGLVKTNSAIDAIASRYSLYVIDNSDLDQVNHPELHGNVNNIHFGKAGNIFIANRLVEDLSEYFADNKVRCEFGIKHIDSRHYPD